MENSSLAEVRQCAFIPESEVDHVRARREAVRKSMALFPRTQKDFGFQARDLPKTSAHRRQFRNVVPRRALAIWKEKG